VGIECEDLQNSDHNASTHNPGVLVGIC
jgi:hypothetical protein